VLSIKLNGATVQLASGLNLEQALQAWNFKETKCAVAVNGEFVAKASYANITLQENDDIEVVTAVGGG
jgi:sulfur carrier protein